MQSMNQSHNMQMSEGKPVKITGARRSRRRAQGSNELHMLLSFSVVSDVNWVPIGHFDVIAANGQRPSCMHSRVKTSLTTCKYK